MKEHCLVGYIGDVRWASDSHFIHANVDTDVIVEEEPENGNPKKPDEIYDIIERFCLGKKRIELFGDRTSIRPGYKYIHKYLYIYLFIYLYIHIFINHLLLSSVYI